MRRPGTPNLPVPVAGPQSAAPGSLLEAHAGARRGLREGGETARARSAYLKAQWSGEDDRRPEPGLLTRTRL